MNKTKNISQILFEKLDDEQKQDLIAGLHAVRSKLFFGLAWNIHSAIRESNVPGDTKLLLWSHFYKQLSGYRSLTAFLLDKGIDVGKYPVSEYRDYCVRWIDHIIFSIKEESRCSRRKILSKLN